MSELDYWTHGNSGCVSELDYWTYGNSSCVHTSELSGFMRNVMKEKGRGGRNTTALNYRMTASDV